MSIRWRGGGRAAVWLPLACVALVHLFIFAVLFRTVYTISLSGTGLYFDDAAKLLAGQVPYRDFTLEYPPLALVFFALPRLAGASFAGYYIGWQIEIVLCDVMILLLLAGVARRQGENLWLTLGVYTALVLAVGPIIFHQFDIFPAAMTLAALYCFQRERETAGWIALTLGVMTKLYPLLLFPVFALPAIVRRDTRALGRAAIACGATVLVVLSPLLVVAPASIERFFAYHADRGIQIESTYGALLLAADKLRLTNVGTSMSFGSWNVTGAGADILTPLSTLALAATFAACCLWLYRRTAERTPENACDVGFLAAGSVLVLTGALVASKVLSPQYIIWLVPVLPLVGRRRYAIWAMFALIGIATYYIFPANYSRLIFQDSGVVITVLVLRNLLLVAFGLLVAASLRGTSTPSAPRAA